MSLKADETRGLNLVLRLFDADKVAAAVYVDVELSFDSVHRLQHMSGPLQCSFQAHTVRLHHDSI